MRTNSFEETIALGEKIGTYLRPGMCLLLEGDLASGKTTFTKGIGKALHINKPISSPTFTILKIYHGDLDLYHIDAYRLEGNDYDLGFDEYMSEGVTVIEWPQYYEDHLPKEYLKISFEYIDDDTREISFSYQGEMYRELYEKVTGESHD